MPVEVLYRLTRRLSCVGSYVESFDAWIFRKLSKPHLRDQLIAGIDFRPSKLEKLGHVPFRNDEHVTIGHGKLVGYGVREFVFDEVTCRRHGTERAALVFLLVRGSDHPKIRIIPVLFHGIAAVTKRLQVRQVI